jgi:hypothetical protein
MGRFRALMLLGLGVAAGACVRQAPPPVYQLRPPPPPPGYGATSPAAATAGRPINVAALRILQTKVRCAPKEVAPGVWVRIDCGAHRPISRARALVPPSRMGLVTGPLPESVDHRADGTEGPVKDQGAVGVCTAFSLSTAMDNAIRRMGRGDVVAPLHVWSKYGVPEMGVAGDETVDKSVTVEQVWPYDPAEACELLKEPFDSCGMAYSVQSGTAAVDPRLRAQQASADAQGRYRIQAVEQFSTPTSTDEIAAVLAGGDDVWASFWVDSNAWMNRTAENPIIPDYQSVEDEGHAVVLAGYRTVNGARQFLVHNSWSDRWGDHGYGWLSEAMVGRWLRAAYKVKVVDASAPEAPSAPPPVQGGCAAGQVRDAVLGTCVAPCPSGSAPAAGVCLPSLPGFPAPGPAPTSSCPQGQAPDMMTGKCTNLCPGGFPAVGGMCLPLLPH